MMTPRSRKDPAQESEAQIPQSAPSTTGYPGRDFDYTLQCVIELQKSFGAKLDAMKSSIDGLRGKVDDLVGWKNKILGGAAALAAVIAALGFLAGKASDYFTLKQPPAAVTAAPPTVAPVPATPKTQ